MILVDANLLIYAVNRDAPGHRKAKSWLESAISGTETVGFSWGGWLTSATANPTLWTWQASTVGITDLITAVNNALNGCPPAPS